MSTPSEASDQILFLAPEFPYPLTGGGPMRSSSLLQLLTRNYDLHLVTFREKETPHPQTFLPSGLVNFLTVVDLPYHGRDFWSRSYRNGVRLVKGTLPLTDRFSNVQTRNTVLNAVEGRHYKLAVIEHFWCAPHLQILRGHADHVILDLHNIESVLHERCARVESWPLNIVHNRFARLARKMERQWIPQFDLVLVSSETDRQRLMDHVPGVPVVVYPNSIPWTRQPLVEEENVIAFSGNWEYHPNLSAVKFFYSKVWPLVQKVHPQLRWRLIGKNAQRLRHVVSGDTKIELAGAVADPVTELAKARLVIVPLLSGSGTRVKILEAWAAGRAVVSTTIGAEGLPATTGKNICLADGHLFFAKAILELLDNKEEREHLGREGRLTYEREGNWLAAWRSTEKWLGDFASGGKIGSESSSRMISLIN